MASPQQLNGVEFVHMMRSGHVKLKDNVSTVNKLNVFPVPDGDTGTNMELSMASGVARLNEQANWTLREAAHGFASGLLMGARGNSGVILSQLFRGFVKVSQAHELLDVEQFAIALSDGVQIAYRAVAKPVEGTILSVASSAASTGMKLAKTHQGSFATWLTAVYESACLALAKTPEQLPVLKQAGVVDSGGQGFVFILEGFLAYVNGERLASEITTTLKADAHGVGDSLSFVLPEMNHEGEFGYCTEVLIRVQRADSAQHLIRRRMSAYGESMLVVGVEDLVKVHIHTLHPGRVLEEAITFGPLLRIKIDNMTEQYTHLQTKEPETVPFVDSGPTVPLQSESPQKICAVVCVASGDGLRAIFESLGVDVVVSGGQTMNPSTEDFTKAVQVLSSSSVVLLPNNKNIVLAAEQAQTILGPHVVVVPTTTVPQGIAAMLAYDANQSVEQNVRSMSEAADAVVTGSIVRAVRDSVFQDREIREGQYLGFINQELVEVSDERETLANEIIGQMKDEVSELVTLFYGASVTEQALLTLRSDVSATHGLKVDAQYGGQPVYDYIFTVE